MAGQEVKVPDLGGSDDVPVIEILVKVGDAVKKDQGLIVLESDKASMEVPAPFAGVVSKLHIKVGDKLSEGSLVATIDSDQDAAKPNDQEASKQPSKSQDAKPQAKEPDSAASKSTMQSEAAAEAEGDETSEETATVPDIGDYENIPVIEILVKVGDTVKKDQGLITLESDKATMEVPAPSAGVVTALLVDLGDTVSAGSAVATLRAESADSAKTKTPPPKAKSDAAKPQPSAAPAAPAKTSDAASPVPAASVDNLAHASPGVRLFARELGADLSKISGTGRKGRILKEDVQTYVKSRLSAPAATSITAGNGLNLLPWPKVDFGKFGPIETVALSRIQKISGANLARNWAMIPHVTQHDLADITEMEAFRKAAQADLKDVKLTPLVFLIKAVVAALQQFPRFNASLEDASGENLVLKQYFHIGIAVDTPDGLVVPVVRDCDKKSLTQLATELANISAKARDKKLGPADMSGGCFSISSLGGIGGTAFTPIVNAPEVAILGVSKSAMQPVWDGSSFVPRLLLPLSLSYDHRVIDGAAAARFTAFLAKSLGDIRRLLL